MSIRDWRDEKGRHMVSGTVTAEMINATTTAVGDDLAASIALKSEVERLRGVVRLVVAYERNLWICPLCDPDGINAFCDDACPSSPHQHHVEADPEVGRPECPWPALVAEAEKS